MTASSDKTVWALKISGWGKGTAAAADQRYRLTSGPYVSDPDGLVLNRQLELPREVDGEVSFLDGPQIGGVTFVLLADGLEEDFLRTDVRKVGNLTATLSPSATSISTDVTDGSLAGAALYVGRETLWVSGHSGAGVYSVNRGRFGTQAVTHPAGRALLLTFGARREALVQLYKSVGTYASEELVASYLWEDAEEGVADKIEVKCQSILWAVSESKLATPGSLWGGEVTSASGVGRLSSLTALSRPPSPFLQDPPAPAAGVVGGVQRMVVSVNKGQLVLVGAWSALDDGAYRFDWDALTDPPPLNFDADLSDPTRLVGLPVSECFVTADEQPASASPPTVASLPLSTNPVRLVRQLLTDGAGVSALGVGLPEALLSTASWDLLEEVTQGYKCARLAVGADGAEVNVLDLARRLWLPLGLALTEVDGQLGVAEWRDLLNYGETGTLLQNQFLAVPRRANNDQIRFDWIKVSTGGYLGAPVQPYEYAVRDSAGTSPRAAPTLEVDLGAFEGGRRLALEVSADLIARYRSSPPVYSGVEVARADADVGLGQVVEITHAKLRAPSGTLGLDAHPALVIGRALDLALQKITYTLLGSPRALDRWGYIAPALQIEGSDGATSSNRSVAVYRRWYQGGEMSATDPDSFGFAVGDKVIVNDSRRNRRFTGSTLTVVSISGQQDEAGNPQATTDRVVLSGVPGSNTLAVTDILIPARYADALTTQREDWAYLGALSDASTPYEYSH